MADTGSYLRVNRDGFATKLVEFLFANDVAGDDYERSERSALAVTAHNHGPCRRGAGLHCGPRAESSTVLC